MKHKTIVFVISVLTLFLSAFVFIQLKKPSPHAIPVNAELLDENLNEITFSSFKGKVVFVNNWASWCPPCVAEMPSIQELKDKLNNEDIVFVMVSFDSDREKALAFMKKKGFDFKVYFPGGKYPYGTESIPATFIIDKTGTIVLEHTGMADYSNEEMVNQIKRFVE
jgi:thiol-disulfide isomerase/thioredoxin